VPHALATEANNYSLDTLILLNFTREQYWSHWKQQFKQQQSIEDLQEGMVMCLLPTTFTIETKEKKVKCHTAAVQEDVFSAIKHPVNLGRNSRDFARNVLFKDIKW
jgi:hypothetical protein